jgi:arsenate reductase (thioredoxin)
MDAMGRHAVLFLCTANSARSQMAEGLLGGYGGERFDAYSAGLELKEIHPLTIRVMEEIGISMAGKRSKPLSEFLGRIPIRYAIVVCEAAERSCPQVWPFGATMLFWPFDDPAATAGSEEARLAKFREVRDEIQLKIIEWLNEIED